MFVMNHGVFFGNYQLNGSLVFFACPVRVFFVVGDNGPVYLFSISPVIVTVCVLVPFSHFFLQLFFFLRSFLRAFLFRGISYCTCTTTTIAVMARNLWGIRNSASSKKSQTT